MEELLHFDSQIRNNKHLKLSQIIEKLKLKGVREIVHADEILREERKVSLDEFRDALDEVPRGIIKTLIDARISSSNIGKPKDIRTPGQRKHQRN